MVGPYHISPTALFVLNGIWYIAYCKYCASKMQWSIVFKKKTSVRKFCRWIGIVIKIQCSYNEILVEYMCHVQNLFCHFNL